jgi:very-short-patch-repair endonuclease
MVLDLKLAIEIMGEQHERPVAFDGDKQQSIRNFERQVERDKLKKRLATEQGWKYLEIWYDEKLTEDYLAEQIIKAIS